MQVQTKPDKLGLLILLIGVFAASTSVVFIRESEEAPVMLAAYRLLITALLLLPLFLRQYQMYYSGRLLPLLRSVLLPSTVLSLHFISWVVGARMTPAANANLIVSLVPLVMPVLMLVMFSERVSRRELIATFIAMLGMLILTNADLNLSREYFIGDIVCFVSMLLFAWYLALSRRYAHFKSIWIYLIPMYWVAGIQCFVIALFFSSPIHPYSGYELSMILCLAVIPTIVGHSLLNLSMQRMRGQIVSIINMAQFIFAGAFGYFLYTEIPSWEFYISSALLCYSAWLVLVPARRKAAVVTDSDPC